MPRRKFTRVMLAATASVGIIFGVSVSAEAAPTVDEQDTGFSIIAESNLVVGDLDQLSATEVALLRSDAPKVVEVDAYSGDVTKVTASSPGGSSSAARAVVTCTSGTACWHKRPPLLSVGFSKGVTNGTWSEVKNFYTGSYYAKLCWIAKGSSTTFCMPERNGANATIELGDYVTGKRVDLATSRNG